MATYTPPPYFPQGSLAPPDEKRYKKFKMVAVAGIVILLLLLVSIGFGVWFVMTRLL